MTPTGSGCRTRIHATALLVPLAAGALAMLAAAVHGLALPWASAGLALAGNVLLGFASACVARRRTGEPGPAAGTAVVLVLTASSLIPQVTRWVRTFPAPRTGGPSPDPYGGPSSRRARWPSPSRSMSEGCPNGGPGFRDPGDTHSAYRNDTVPTINACSPVYPVPLGHKSMTLTCNYSFADLSG